MRAVWEERQGKRRKDDTYLRRVVAFGSGEPLCARDEVALGRRVCRTDYLDTAPGDELSRVQAIQEGGNQMGGKV